MKKHIVLLALVLLPIGAMAQEPQSGFPPYGSFQVDRFDGINRQNLNVNLAIPIVSVPGRGKNFSYSIVYDSLVWMKNGSAWSPVADSGWKKATPTGKITYILSTQSCGGNGGGGGGGGTTAKRYKSYVYTDTAGTRHNFALDFYDIATSCGYPTTPREGYATDGSGIYLDATNPELPEVIISSGTEIGGIALMDANGNHFSLSVQGSIASWIDTLGRVVLKIETVSSTTIKYHVLDQTGGYQITTMTLTNTNVKTAFACTGVTENTGSAYLPTTILLPNGRSYSMTYEATPGATGYMTGRLKKITLPTGGYYEYTYPTTGNKGTNCADGTGTSLTRKISDGTIATWTLTRAQVGSNWETTVTAPTLSYDTAGNRSIFTYDSSGRLITQKFYQGSTTLLRTINTTWNTAENTPTSTTVILADSPQQSKVETTFDIYGNLKVLKEYDWGSGTPGPLKRTTDIQYITASQYTDRNILDRVTQVSVKDGSGVVKSRTDIAYDEPAYSNQNCPPGAAQHDDANYGCAFTYRGNPTTVTTYTSPATQGGAELRHFTYDWFGNVIKADVNCCQQKQWNFSSATQYAYPDSAVDGPPGGPQLTTTFTYNFYTGLLTSTTDPNQKTTNFAYDNFGRPSSVTRPDNQQITTAYDDVARTVTVEAPIQGSDRARQVTYFDILGRSFKQCLLDGGGATVSCTQNQFDKFGRPYKGSNPFTTSAQYWTETRFDGLGRPTMTIPPDGTASTNRSTFAYSGDTVTVTDPAGKTRRSKTDALGRLIQVNEPNESGGGSSPTAGTGSVGITGSVQSTGGSSTPGTGSVTISGSVQTNGYPVWDPNFIADSGEVYITVNGYTASTSYSYGTTASNIASSLRSIFNNDTASPVTAGGTGTTVTLTSKLSGPNTNYPLSAGSNYDTANFSSPSFTTGTSGSTLTGGSGPQYDNGNVSITVNGQTKTVNYSQGSTASSVASALRSAINGDATYPVTASGSSGTVTLTAKTTGASTNYSLSAGTTWNTSLFSQASFTVTPSGSALTGGSDGNDPYSGGYFTTYAYNVLDQLMQVSQGVQTRTYNYDGLGRLTSVATPEAGTVSYVYNSFNLVTQRTDARGIVTSYSYDGMNRLTGVSYSDTTPAVTFAYGTSAAANNNGRLTSMTDGTGSESYTYDILGRITQVLKAIDGVNYPMQYAYNLASELTAITYPSGRVVEQSYDPVGRLSQVISGATTYASLFSYSAAGQVTGFNYGNGVAAIFGYSAERLQLTSLKYTQGAATLFHLSYGYTQGGGNNGQITSITDNVESGRTATYAYDALGRLQDAATAGSAAYPKWHYVYNYDRYGNLLAKNLQADSVGTHPTLSISVSTTSNRITSAGFAYDASGNMTNDGQYSYTYDAENRAKTGAGATYSYDGAGLRVKKVAADTTRYIFSGVKVVAEYVNGAAVGSPAREYIYSGSALLATIEGSTTTYHHQDRLSVRVNTDSNGAVVGQQGNYPFGEAWYTTSATTKWRFTSYERDAESGNDYAIFRYHANRLGRFTAPDPLAGRISNPQSLNRYAYVSNDPIRFIDPLGLQLLLGGAGSDCGPGCEIYEPPAPTAPLDMPTSGPGGGGLGSGVDSHCPGGFNFLEYVCSESGENTGGGGVTGVDIPTPGPGDPAPPPDVVGPTPPPPPPPLTDKDCETEEGRQAVATALANYGLSKYGLQGQVVPGTNLRYDEGTTFIVNWTNPKVVDKYLAGLGFNNFGGSRRSGTHPSFNVKSGSLDWDLRDPGEDPFGHAWEVFVNIATGGATNPCAITRALWGQ